MPSHFPDIEIPEDLIRRMDIRGPRYTSYPTADRFHAKFAEADYLNHLEQRAPAPLSLYVHVPFCASLCYYCACNRIITKDHRRSTKYLRYLETEMAMLAKRLGTRQQAVQLHLGGGTPTFLNAEELRQLMQMLHQHFDIGADAEVSIEIDPRTIEPETMPLLATLGFNRLSLGVQDLDAAVQKAVHRIQPLDMIERVVADSRAAGFGSINFDLIYGLPKQTLEGFSRTLDDVIRLAPERIALYNYAHLPTRFLPQRRIAESDLPSAEERLQIFLMAIRRLLQAGYIYIGLDHFAKPEDEMARALAERSLHRNFQGYTTLAGVDLIGMGVSSISKVGQCYSQSVRTLDDYYQQLDAGQLPVERGFELNADDVLRRRIIMDLMCNVPIDFAGIGREYGVDFASHFSGELKALQPLAQEGLIAIDAQTLRVLPKGRLFVRAVAMAFDSHLRKPAAGSFSRVI